MNSKIIGITGGIGSGKSEVSRAFGMMGVPVFESDVEAKVIIDTDYGLRQSIIERWGDDLYSDDKLNKPKLAQIVFSDKEELEVLNQWVHPRVKTKFESWVKDQNAEWVAKETALLFEKKLHIACDYTILVVADIEKRIERVKKRSGWTETEISARMKAQWTDQQKMPMADYVLENNDTLAELEEAAEITFKKIKKQEQIKQL